MIDHIMRYKVYSGGGKRVSRIYIATIIAIVGISAILGSIMFSQAQAPPDPSDRYGWLETMSSPEINAWIAAANNKTEDYLKSFAEYDRLLNSEKARLERASNDLLPKINEAKSKAEQAQGANNAKLYYQFLFAASALAGQWHENQDMLKEVV